MHQPPYGPAGPPQGPWTPPPFGQQPPPRRPGPNLAVVIAVSVSVVFVAVVATVVVLVAQTDSEPEPTRTPTFVTPTPTSTTQAQGGGQKFTSTFAGSWKGKITTSSGSWQVQYTLPQAADAGSVQYFQDNKLACIGTVKAISVGGTVLKLDEQTPGCNPNKSGVVKLTSSGSTLLHRWYSNETNYTADSAAYYGTLSRLS